MIKAGIAAIAHFTMSSTIDPGDAVKRVRFRSEYADVQRIISVWEQEEVAKRAARAAGQSWL